MLSETTSDPQVGTPTGTELRLSTDLCEALRAEAFAGLKALPKRGAEVGGLLTGQGDEDPISIIDGFELIQCEHRYGPFYRLSPLDCENFHAKCRELKAGDAVRVAGFFRSSTRETFQVTPEDLKLVREVLSDAAAIVLIKPTLSGHATFRVFQAAKDPEWREFEEFEVRNKLIIPPAPALAAASVTPENPSVRQPPQVEIGTRYSIARPFPRKRLAAGRTTFFWVFGVLAIVVAFYFAARDIGRPVQPAARASNPDLGMQLLSEGDSLRLTWNRSLSPVRDSGGGVLQIHDGEQYREIALDSAQVAQAVIYYLPSSDDVTFRLNIRSRDQGQLSGIARILARRKAATPLTVSNQPAGPSPIAPAPPNRPKIPLPERVYSKPPLPLPSRAYTDRPDAASKAPSQITDRSGPNTAEFAVRKLPETAPRQVIAAEVRGSPPLQAQSVPAAPLIPTSDPSPQPSRTNTEADVSGSPSLALAPTDLPVPGRPVKKVVPLRHSPGAPPVLSVVAVTVDIKIDSQGNVVEAHAQRGPSQYWSSRAVEAAKQWRYEPARLHGQSVPSITTIEFRFNP